MTANNIRYLYSAETDIELIFCKDSTISYPLHNHVSVLTIGIILDGSVIPTTNKETRAYKPNETFAIFPYEPHSIFVKPVLSTVFSNAAQSHPDTLHTGASIPEVTARLSLSENERYAPLIPLISGYKPASLFCHKPKVSKSMIFLQNRKGYIQALDLLTGSVSLGTISSAHMELTFLPPKIQYGILPNTQTNSRRILDPITTISELFFQSLSDSD